VRTCNLATVVVVVVVSIIFVVDNILVLDSSITTTVTVITLLTYTSLRLVTSYFVVEGEIRDLRFILLCTIQDKKFISKTLESTVIDTTIYGRSH
jgi:hypothetical protein